MRKGLKISLAVLAVAAFIIFIKTTTSALAQPTISNLSYFERGEIAGATLRQNMAFMVVITLMAVNGLYLTFSKQRKS
jgi:hypothetical protein